MILAKTEEEKNAKKSLIKATEANETTYNNWLQKDRKLNNAKTKNFDNYKNQYPDKRSVTLFLLNPFIQRFDKTFHKQKLNGTRKKIKAKL